MNMHRIHQAWREIYVTFLTSASLVCHHAPFSTSRFNPPFFTIQEEFFHHLAFGARVVVAKSKVSPHAFMS